MPFLVVANETASSTIVAASSPAQMRRIPPGSSRLFIRIPHRTNSASHSAPTDNLAHHLTTHISCWLMAAASSSVSQRSANSGPQESEIAISDVFGL